MRVMDVGRHQRGKIWFLGAEVNVSERELSFSFTSSTTHSSNAFSLFCFTYRFKGFSLLIIIPALLFRLIKQAET